MIPPALRNAALRRKNTELVRRMVNGDEQLATKLIGRPKERRFNAVVVPACQDLTVCITNFKRADKLERAIKSCCEAGVPHVVVASMEPDHDVRHVIMGWQLKTDGWLTWTHLDVDLGCAELWLQSVYRARTEYVLVLHDDDYLDPSLGRIYREQIVPALVNGAGFVSWRAHVVKDDGTQEVAEYFEKPTGEYPSTELEAVLLTDNRMSLSPIVSVLRRGVVIDALKESQSRLNGPDNFLHPTMQLGTELIVYLRHCSTFEKWFYINEVLSRYGSWPGSGTVKAQAEGQTEVLKHGYNLARRYYRTHRENPDRVDPRILFVYSDYAPHTPEEKRRMDFARSSWLPHFERGTMLEFPVGELKRSSATIGDPRPVPYVKDLIDYGMSMAMPNDIVVLANRDVILTTEASRRIIDGVARGRGAAPALRRNVRGRPPKAFLKTAKCCHADTGFDLFAFTPAWWRENASKMPDMLLGREAWDSVMRTLMDQAAGRDTRIDDVFYHELHSSYWSDERVTNPGQLHNRALALEFFKGVGDQWMIQMLSVSNPEQLFSLESAKRATLPKHVE